MDDGKKAEMLWIELDRILSIISQSVCHQYRWHDVKVMMVLIPARELHAMCDAISFKPNITEQCRKKLNSTSNLQCKLKAS